MERAETEGGEGEQGRWAHCPGTGGPVEGQGHALAGRSHDLFSADRFVWGAGGLREEETCVL